ncbi:hypothetical protein [Siminovitchia terrae]|nr:hypothetical protein [Siminovitchia terrae]
MNKKKAIVPLMSTAILFPSATNVFAEPHKAPSPVKSVEFVGMDAPDTSKKRSAMYSDASVVVTLKDGSQKTVPMEYKSLARPGEVINGKTVGAAYDVNGHVIKDKNGNRLYPQRQTPTPY